MPYKDPARQQEWQRKYNQSHDCKAYNKKFWRRNKVLYRYGLSEENYDALRKLPCEVCGNHNGLNVIDHDHSQKRSYRGVLCNTCNRLVGWFEKRKQIILTYVTKESICHKQL